VCCNKIIYYSMSLTLTLSRLRERGLLNFVANQDVLCA